MSSKLRDALPPCEFKERYIIRRLLCENYMRHLPQDIIYNHIKGHKTFLESLEKYSYRRNIRKRIKDDEGYFDYDWKSTDDFTRGFERIDETGGIDVEYDKKRGKIVVETDLSRLGDGKMILRIGFPEHFTVAVTERRGNIIYFTTFDSSGIDYERRNLDYNSDHRGFQTAMRRWIRENTYFHVKFLRPEVNVCLQYVDDWNCQTWAYYYIHLVFIDTTTRRGNWRTWLKIIEGKCETPNRFELQVFLNSLLEEFIKYMYLDHKTLFIPVFPLHYASRKYLNF